MLSLSTIVYTVTTNEANIQEALDYILRHSFRQAKIEQFVEQITRIQSTQAQSLLKLLVKNEHHITILDQIDDESPTHIDSSNRCQSSSSSIIQACY